MNTYSNKQEFWCLVEVKTFKQIQLYLTQFEIEQEIIRLYGTLNNNNVVAFFYSANSTDFNTWQTVPGNELIDWVENKVTH